MKQIILAPTPEAAGSGSPVRSGSPKGHASAQAIAYAPFRIMPEVPPETGLQHQSVLRASVRSPPGERHGPGVPNDLSNLLPLSGRKAGSTLLPPARGRSAMRASRIGHRPSPTHAGGVRPLALQDVPAKAVAR